MNIYDLIFRVQEGLEGVGSMIETGSDASSPKGDVAETVTRTMWDLIWGYDPITKEYSLSSIFVMSLLFILAGLAIYIFIERFLTIRQSLQGEKDFMTKVKMYVENGKLDDAKQLCRSTENPVARMVEKGVMRIGKPMEDIATSIENVAKLEVYRLEARLSILGTISGVAPMLGMLGTVLGMVGTLSTMAAKKSVQIPDLASGIFEAMITTIAGLIVGIIAYVSYNYLTSKVEKVIQKMEGGSIEFLDILEAPGN